MRKFKPVQQGKELRAYCTKESNSKYFRVVKVKQNILPKVKTIVQPGKSTLESAVKLELY